MTGKNVFLIENDKGLYTSNGEKVYFPRQKEADNSSLVPGLYHVSNVVEKDKYGFLDVQPVEVDNIGDVILNNQDVFQHFQQKHIEEYYVLGNTQFWVEGDTINCFVDGVPTPILTYSIFSSDKRTKRINYFWHQIIEQAKEKAQPISLNGIYKASLDQCIQNLPDIPLENIENIYEQVIAKLHMRPVQVVVYGNKLICVKVSTWFKEGFDYSFIYNQSGYETIERFISDPVLGSLEYKDITAEFLQFANEHTVYFSMEPGLISKTVSVFGERVEVKAISSTGFSIRSYKNHQKEIIKSLQELEDLRRRAAKIVNKSNLEELSKLSIKNILAK